MTVKELIDKLSLFENDREVEIDTPFGQVKIDDIEGQTDGKVVIW